MDACLQFVTRGAGGAARGAAGDTAVPVQAGLCRVQQSSVPVGLYNWLEPAAKPPVHHGMRCWAPSEILPLLASSL